MSLAGGRGPEEVNPVPVRTVGGWVCGFSGAVSGAYLLRYAALMAMKPRTGAAQYLAKQQKDPEYRAAYEKARRRIDQVDAIVRSLDDRREALGLTKAELARGADLAPEAVRRLFSVESPNPTAITLAALADALDLDLVPTPRAKVVRTAGRSARGMPVALRQAP